MAASDNRRPSGGHTLFRYTAKDIDGRTVRGTMEAADYDALYAQLLEQGLYPQRVTGRGADRRPRGRGQRQARPGRGAARRPL